MKRFNRFFFFSILLITVLVLNGMFIESSANAAENNNLCLFNNSDKTASDSGVLVPPELIDNIVWALNSLKLFKIESTRKLLDKFKSGNLYDKMDKCNADGKCLSQLGSELGCRYGLYLYVDNGDAVYNAIDISQGKVFRKARFSFVLENTLPHNEAIKIVNHLFKSVLQNEFNRIIELAVKQENEKDFNNAIDTYKKAISLKTNDGRALVGLVRIYLKLNKTDEAEAIIKMPGERGKYTSESEYLKAIVWLYNKDISKSSDQFYSIIQLGTDDIFGKMAFLHLSILRSDVKKLEKTSNEIAELIKSGKLSSFKILYTLNLAKRLLDYNYYAPANIIAEQILELDSKNNEAYVLSAKALIGLEKFEETSKLLDSIITKEERDQSSLYHYVQAKIFEKKVENSKAKESYLRSLELRPSDLNVTSAFLNFLVKKNEVNGIKSLYNQYKDIKGEGEKYSEIMLNMGIAFYKAGNKKLAINAYNAALKANNTNIEATMELSELYEKEGDITSTIDALNNAKRLQPHNPEINLKLARLYIKQGQFLKAIQPYDEVFKVNSENNEIAKEYGELLSSAGQYEKAVYVLENVLKNNPTNFEVYRTLGDIYRKSGNFDKAEANYLKFSQIMPVTDDYKSDYSLKNKIIFDPAYPEMFISVEGDKKIASLRNNLALSMASKGMYSSAALEFENILKSRKDFFEAKHNLALVFLKLGYVEKAILIFEEAVELNKDSEITKLALCASYLRVRKIKEADEILVKLNNHGNKRGYIYINRAITSALNKNYSKAETLFNKAVNVMPNNSKAVYNLAALMYKISDNTKARRYALRALSLNHSYPEALYLNGLLELNNNKTVMAEKHFQGALSLRPDYAVALYELGIIYLNSENYNNAEKLFKNVIRLDSKFEEAHTQLGVIYGKTGREELEVAQYRKAGEIVKKDRDKRKLVNAKVLGIVKFTGIKADEKYKWLEMGIAEALTTDLQNLKGLKVVDRMQLNKTLKEMELGQTGIMEDSSAAKAGKMLKLDVMLTGSYSVTKEKVRIDARIIDANDTHVIKTASAFGNVDTIFELERKLALDLFTEYLGITNEERQTLLSSKITSVDNLRNIAQGRLLLFAGNKDAAKEMFRKAMKEDPAYAAALEEMQQAWGDTAAAMAIMPFSNTAGLEDYAWLGRGIAESLTTDLKKITGIYMVERMAVDKALNELGMVQAMDFDRAPEIGKFVGANMLLLGSYQVLDKKIQIDARLIDVETAQILMAGKVDGKVDDIFELQSELAEDIAKALNIEITEDEKKLLSQNKPSLDEFKRFIKSQTKLSVVKEKERAVKIAVSPLIDLANPGKFSELGKEFSDYFTLGLMSMEGTEVVDSAAVRKVLEEMALSQAGVTEAGVKGFKDRLGLTDAVLAGTYQKTGDKIRLNIRLINIKDGSVLATAGCSKDIDDIEDARKTVLCTLCKDAGLSVPDDLENRMEKKADEEGRNLDEMFALEPLKRDDLKWAKYSLGTGIASGIIASMLFIKTSSVLVDQQKAWYDYNNYYGEPGQDFEDPNFKKEVDKRYDEYESYKSQANIYQVSAYSMTGLSVATLGYSIYKLLTYEPVEPGKSSFNIVPAFGKNSAFLSFQF